MSAMSRLESRCDFDDTDGWKSDVCWPLVFKKFRVSKDSRSLGCFGAGAQLCVAGVAMLAILPAPFFGGVLGFKGLVV